MYGVLKALEESGRIRRGYFVDGLGATQFALPAAVDLLRSLRADREPRKTEVVQLAAQDPAQPYGSVLRWPRTSADDVEETVSGNYDAEREIASADRPRLLLRSAGARVILRNGVLLGYLRGGGVDLQTFLPEEEPDHTRAAEDLARFLAERGAEKMRGSGRRGLLIATINGEPAGSHSLTKFFVAAGFYAGTAGLHLRRSGISSVAAANATEEDEFAEVSDEAEAEETR